MSQASDFWTGQANVYFLWVFFLPFNNLLRLSYLSEVQDPF